MRKIRKLRGGGMDARDFDKQSTSKADFSAVGPGSVYAKNVAAAGGNNVKQKKVSSSVVKELTPASACIKAFNPPTPL